MIGWLGWKVNESVEQLKNTKLIICRKLNVLVSEELNCAECGLCHIVCAGMLVSQEETSLPYSPIWESIQTQGCVFSPYCFTWGLVFPSVHCLLLIQHSPSDTVTWCQTRSRNGFNFFFFALFYYQLFTMIVQLVKKSQTKPSHVSQTNGNLSVKNL